MDESKQSMMARYDWLQTHSGLAKKELRYQRGKQKNMTRKNITVGTY